jgi:hypothetical protein
MVEDFFYLINSEGKNHIEIEMLQLSNRSMKHVDIVYRIEDMKTELSYQNWHTYRCQLGKKLTFRRDFEPIFPDKFALIRGFSPSNRNAKINQATRINAPLLSLHKYLNHKVIKKTISPNLSKSNMTSSKRFENEIINNNNFSIMFFSRIRAVREDLGGESKSSERDCSKSFLVSDSLNMYSENLDMSKIDKLNQFVSKIQDEKDFIELSNKMKIENNDSMLDDKKTKNVCEVILTPDKDIICSQKKKSLDISVTFFVKGSFKIYIDIYSFPINTFLQGKIYKEFCQEFFNEKLIQKFILFYNSQKNTNKNLFNYFTKDIPDNGNSAHSLPSQLSLQLSLKSNLRTYTNNSVYRRDTTKRESIVKHEKGIRLSTPLRRTLKKDFLELIFNKISKKMILGFLKKNVSKKDICTFLTKNICMVDIKSIQKSSIVAEANDISQASIEIKEITKETPLIKTEELNLNTSTKISKLPKKLKNIQKINQMSTISYRNDAFNTSQLQTTKYLVFETERMNFAKKRFLLVNNGESKIQFELSLLQSVFQESNLRDETQIDQIDTDIKETQRTIGISPCPCLPINFLEIASSGFSGISSRKSNNSYLSDLLMDKTQGSEFKISENILKKQIDYKFKSKNGQLYSRLVKMKKLVKNIFFRYPNEDVVFSIFPMKGEIESKSFKEIEIYCFGKRKLILKDKLIIGKS